MDKSPFSSATSSTSSGNGTFSTGICDLFVDPRRRTDCCAVAFCGVLVHDRNRHAIAYQQHPPPWWRRILVHIAVPFVGFAIVRDCLYRMQQLEWNAKCLAAFPNDGSGPFLDVMNTTLNTIPSNSTNVLSDEGNEEMERLSRTVFGCGAATQLWVLVLLLRAARHRRTFRKALLENLHSSREGVSPTQSCQHAITDDQIQAASGIVGWYSIAANERRTLARLQASETADLCSCLFGCLAHLCCSWGCNCWCQCCGMCAAAQEERAIQDQFSAPPTTKSIDYITFEPFDAYGSTMESVRANDDRTWRSHFAAQSRLSKLLWRFWLVGVGALAAVALLPWMQFTAGQFLVVLATFLQAFVVLYLVYWRKHRMDVSLDTVTKCFAVGFLISTQLAMVSESMVSALMDAVIQFIFVTEHRSPPIRWCLAIIMPAGQAFVVAAMSEELTKYFGFWMVETPDACEVTEKPERRSLEAVAAGITASMVATATGFACCENLEYVFASGGDARTEISTLLLRSMFPVHPLAAAIQSIGVCRRDIEGYKSFSLGRILLPAVLVHGFFDFFLMVAPVIQQLVSSLGQTEEQNPESHSNTTAYNAYIHACNATIDSAVWEPIDTPTDATSTSPADGLANVVSSLTMCCSVITVMVGILYYVVLAKKQRLRIKTKQQVTPHETTPLIP